MEFSNLPLRDSVIVLLIRPNEFQASQTYSPLSEELTAFSVNIPFDTLESLSSDPPKNSIHICRIQLFSSHIITVNIHIKYPLPTHNK